MAADPMYRARETVSTVSLSPLDVARRDRVWHCVPQTLSSCQRALTTSANIQPVPAPREDKVDKSVANDAAKFLPRATHFRETLQRGEPYVGSMDDERQGFCRVT